MKKLGYAIRIIGIVVLIWGFGSVLFAAVNIAGVLEDSTYAAETALMVLNACKTNLIRGIVIEIVGLIGILLSYIILKRNK
ncbi:MAG: hypothetical protein Q4P20_01435 [Eubacteriales bacterium]|nr:hypothetical protein [Eubacteriales bacterium]